MVRPGSAAYPTHMSLMQPTVVLVDDHEDTRVLLRYVLEESGYCVGEFPLAEEFLDHLRNAGRPSVALVDLRLPDADGMRLPHIVQNEIGASVPLIAVSAHVVGGVKEQALTAGFVDFISKPIDMDSLVASVKRHLPSDHA